MPNKVDDRTLRPHVSQVISYIELFSKKDAEKMLHLVHRVFCKFQASILKIPGLFISKNENDNSISKKQEIWDLVGSSLSAFFSKIQTDNAGRYSKDVRAAYIHTAAALTKFLL